jgi:glycopeptide antibiotics resistance protein
MQRRHWSYFILIASFVWIVVATLSPFKFSPPENLSPQSILNNFHHTSDVKDYSRNIILFIPFGLSLAAILSQSNYQRLAILMISLATSLGLSFSVELIQSFSAIRISNLTDIVTNTFGCLLGAAVYSWRKLLITFTTAVMKTNGRRLTVKSLTFAFSGLFILICTAIWVLLMNANFNNWNDNFDLSIGNESTGNRPWQGYISSLHILDNALDSESVTKVFNEKNNFFAQLPNPVVSLVATPDGQMKASFDRQVPPLLWQGTISSDRTGNLSQQLPAQFLPAINSGIPQEQRIFIDQNHWLKNKEPIVYINSRLRKKSEFTLSTIVATSQLKQNGLARIISISKNPFYRNLTLGQNGQNLSLRLRTPITGENGTEPEFIIPDVFKDKNSHQILITFAHQVLSFYIDRSENKYTFRFEPEVTFPSYYPGPIKNWQINLKDFSKLKYQIAFYAISLIPLGFLGGLLSSLLKVKNRWTVWWLLGICLLPALLIEQLSVIANDQPVRGFNLLLSIAILSTTVLITHVCCLKRLSAQ